MSPILCLAREGDTLAATGVTHFELDPERRTGASASWHWDGHVLRAATDSFGSYPIYYSARKDGICLSSSLPALLNAGAPTELDLQAIAAFLQFGCFFGEDTPFTAIRSVPAAGQLEWRAGGSWSVTASPPRVAPQNLSRGAALDAFIDTFAAAVRRREPHGEPAVALTGGRDSRHLLFAMLESARVIPRAVSVRHFYPSRADDVRVASLVAAATGVHHEVLDQYSSRLESELRVARLCSFMTDWHAWALPLVDHLEEHSGQDLYTGHGGDAIARGRPFNAERAGLWLNGDAEVLADMMLAGKSDRRALMGGLLSPAVAELSGTPVTRAWLARELAQHMDAPNPELSYTMAIGLRRRTAPLWFPMCADHARIVVPYLDETLYALMASLPLSLALDQEFHTQAINRAFPKFSGLPYAAHVPHHTPSPVVRQFAEEARRYVRARRHSALFDLPALARAIEANGSGGLQRGLESLQLPRILCLLALEEFVEGLATPRPVRGGPGGRLLRQLRSAWHGFPGN